jgi:ketosteroid isomerase-like protein
MDSTTVKNIIQQHNANLSQWYAAGEIDKLARVFAEDCWQMPPNMEPMVGREGLRAGWAQAVQFG